jgi:hypothetical protein
VDFRTSPATSSINANGMPDAPYELALLEVVLKDDTFSLPNGLTHQLAHEAWDHNEAQFGLDVGPTYWPPLSLVANGMPQILKGYMTVGDGAADTSVPDYISCTGSAGFVAMIMFMMREYFDTGAIDLNNYARLPQYFGPDGDADGDGYTNAQEWTAYGSDPQTAVANALDPEVHP